MGLLTAAIAALGIMQAGQSIAGGIAQSTEAKYNAKIKEQQAQMIGAAQNVEAMQYNRQIGRAASTSIQRTAKSGLAMSGSPMAKLLDTQTQMEMDKAIGQYNLEVQKRFALSEAEQYKKQSKLYMTQGITQGFTQLLTTGLDYGMKAGWATKPSMIKGGVGGVKTGQQYANKRWFPTWSPYK